MAAPKRLKIASGRKRLRVSMSNKGIVEAKAKVSTMQRKVTNLQSVLKVGARDIETLMKRGFELEEDPGGKKWTDLKPSTKKARITRGAEAKQRTKEGKLTKKALKKRAARMAPGGIKILQLSRDLFGSMTAVVKHNAIVFGSNKKYLAHHQLGTKNMVARKVAPVERRGNNWALIKRGRALAVFERLDKEIRKHVAGASLSVGAK